MTFDGVVHDTFEFHREKIREITGINLSREDLRRIHHRNFNNCECPKLRNTDWEEYSRHIHSSLSSLRIEDRIKDTISKLGMNYELYINSACGTSNIQGYLKNNKVASYFREVLGGDSHKSKTDKFRYIFDRYSLTPNDCIFVTDTLGDILEAKEVEVRTIAVDSGYHNRETLETGKPYIIISNLEELIGIINSNFLSN